jgi:hypothetical protein
MPITFEEVTADVDRGSRGEPDADAQAPAPRIEDTIEQLERSLRVRDERLARLCDD